MNTSIKFFCSALFTFMLSFAVSCGGGSGSSDTTAPTVTLTAPLDSATNVAINTEISATFSEAMNPSTIDETSFTLYADTTPISGEVTYTGTTATFTADSDFDYSTIYTATITTTAKDIAGNALSANKVWTFTTTGAKKFFCAKQPASGYELWVTDATTEGTKLVKDINAGANDGSPYGFTAMGGKTYFAAEDGSSGSELWVTDGTDAGTHMVKNINGTSSYSIPNAGKGYWAVMNNKLYFVADNGTTGDELWVSDGTEAGTQIVKDINEVETAVGSGITKDSAPYELTVMNGKLYFSADDGVNGSELWVSDGTETGTARLTNINTSGNSSVSQFTPIGNKLYFRAYDGGASYGCALWVYDADLSSASLVKDPNTTDSALNWDNIDYLVAMDGLLYFVGQDVTGNTELWVSDGTGTGTAIVTEIRTGTTGSAPWQPVAINGKLYFCATNGISGQDLWISDGTALDTYGIDIANTPTSDPSYCKYFTGLNGLVYFKAYDSSDMYELWVTDGTDAGTHVVKIIEPNGGSSPEQLTVVNNKLLFVAYTDAEGVELWVTDGTEEGTMILKDINPGTGDGDPYL